MLLLHIYKKENITKINWDTSRCFSVQSPTLPAGLSAGSLLSMCQPTLAAVLWAIMATGPQASLGHHGHWAAHFSGSSWPLGRALPKWLHTSLPDFHQALDSPWPRSGVASFLTLPDASRNFQNPASPFQMTLRGSLLETGRICKYPLMSPGRQLSVCSKLGCRPQQPSKRELTSPDSRCYKGGGRVGAGVRTVSQNRGKKVMPNGSRKIAVRPQFIYTLKNLGPRLRTARTQ